MRLILKMLKMNKLKNFKISLKNKKWKFNILPHNEFYKDKVNFN